MFEDPEYASYIRLMREVRLERKAEAGDWFLSFDPATEPTGFDLRLCNDDGGGCWGAPEPLADGWQVIWVPRLDQWLSKLEEAGYATVEFVARAIDMERYLYGAHPEDMDRFTGWLDSREEAAARLYCAVTGRQVPE